MACLPDYAELHCLSNFSFLRGASHAEELVERAAALGYSALAITDECSVAGIVRAHVAAKDLKMKLVIGSEFMLVDGLKLVLLVEDLRGYEALCELITKARRAACCASSPSCGASTRTCACCSRPGTSSAPSACWRWRDRWGSPRACGRNTAARSR